MQNKKTGMLVISMALLAACSTTTKQETATQSDPSNGVICTYEVPTGSSLRERKCTTPEQRALERSQSEHQTVIQPAAGNAR
jgi:hypothetical protein